MIVDKLVNEVVDGIATIIEYVVYDEETVKSVYYIKRFWRPENPVIIIPEPPEKCAEELRHLVGIGKFTVTIDDYTWEIYKRDKTAQFREFKIVT